MATLHIEHPVTDLAFASVAGATAFRQFLEERVWAVPSNAPALAGSPRTMILEPAGD